MSEREREISDGGWDERGRCESVSRRKEREGID